MTQTLKIINFEQSENPIKGEKEKKTAAAPFIKITAIFNLIIAISALLALIFKYELILQYKTIFTISVFVFLLFTSYLLGKISNNKKSYKLEILNNKKLQNERTVEEMFHTSTIPLFQLSENGEFKLYNTSLSKLLNSKKLNKVNFFNDFGIEPKVKKHIIQKLRMKGSLENYRLWLKDKDGNELYVNMNCKYVNCNKTSNKVIEGSLFDITLQYKKEQAIAKELESLRTEKIITKNTSTQLSDNNVLTPSMGHELKTPISSMMGFLTLIEKELYENKNELNNFTISAKKSGEELLEIINKMLGNAIESEEEELEKNEYSENNQPSLTDTNTLEIESNLVKDVIDKPHNSTEQIDRNDSSKPKLLLVEDNKLNQDVETKLLQKVGYSVTVIDNGEDAIELIKNNDFDLILMDIELNGMDGLEATKIIRDLDSEKSNIPIIAATAKSSMKDRERCLAAGMNDYISKPINITFMKMTIDQWLNQKKWEV
jgi:CheY-like chemotaxis protein